MPRSGDDNEHKRRGHGQRRKRTTSTKTHVEAHLGWRRSHVLTVPSAQPVATTGQLYLSQSPARTSAPPCPSSCSNKKKQRRRRRRDRRHNHSRVTIQSNIDSNAPVVTTLLPVGAVHQRQAPTTTGCFDGAQTH